MPWATSLSLDRFFSHRWDDFQSHPNDLTEAIHLRRETGLGILDLTVSNPTHCGFAIPEWAPSIQTSPRYEPSAQGDVQARKAIAEYYASRGESIESDDLFLTAGTSEGYSHLFKLLCNPGDTVLIPQPSYPLLQSLAQLEGIELAAYNLIPGPTWRIDRPSLEALLSDSVKAIGVIQPNNPTGNVLDPEDKAYLAHLSEKYALPILVDEVFSDYRHDGGKTSLLKSEKSLLFTLNGLSKVLGLPQLKLAWIHVAGETYRREQAKERLEWICDAYLSVSGPAQSACCMLLPRRVEFQSPIQNRIRQNLTLLREASTIDSILQPYWPQGGWSIPLRCAGIEDESFAISLLQQEGVLVHPSYFFDFPTEDILVLSLLTEPTIFKNGIQAIARHLHANR